MERLNKAKTVYIIGSESTISKNVENQLLSKRRLYKEYLVKIDLIQV